MNNLRYERYKKYAKLQKKPNKPNQKRLFSQRKKRFLLSFSITFLALSLIVGSVIFILMWQPNEKQVDATTQQKIEAPSNDIRAKERSFTMLLGVYSDVTSEPVEFILYRLDIESRRTVILPVPTNLEIIYNGTRTSLKSVYKEGNISDVSEAISKNYTIDIDYTTLFGSDNFQKLFYKLGGIYLDVPKTFEFRENAKENPIRLTKGRKQYICGDKIYALIASDTYIDDEGKLDIEAEIMKQFVENKLTGLYIKEPQYYFGPIFNLANTRFSMDDLLKSSYYIENYSKEENIKVVKLSLTKDTGYGGLEKIDDISVFNEYFK